MKHIFITIIMLSIMTSCNRNKPQNRLEAAVNRIDSIFTARYSPDGANFPNPGGAVLILKGDSVLFDKGYGIADLETGAKIDGNTFFNIASCSKQFTAVAILKLFEERGLNVNSSIYDVTPLACPYLPPKRKPFTDITVGHLMSHSSGIGDLRDRSDRNFTLTATDMQSIGYIKEINSLNFAPGTAYEYQNPTFDLLFLYIEKLTGQKFDDYMRENIFIPAGMDSTLYFEAGRHIPNMAHGYCAKAPDTEEVDKTFYEYDYGEESFFATKADGGIYTSTRQMASWIRAMRDNKLISKELRDEAWSFKTKVSGSVFCDYQNRPNTFYGYGWFLEQQPDMPLKVYHTGDNGGFQIYEGYFPSSDVTVLVFENRNDHSRWTLVKQLDAILKESQLLNLR